MSQQMPTPNPDDQRTDLMAMLSAARELGPDMDKSLVDSYMTRQTAEAERRRQRAAGQPGQPGLPGNSRMLWYIGLGALGGVLLLATIGSLFWGSAIPGAQGEHGTWFPFFFPWLFFPLIFFWIFGRRGYYRSHRRYWYETDDGRRVNVYERTRGYGPDSGSAGSDPRDPYGAPPAQRPDAPPPEYRSDYHTDYRSDYRREYRDPPANPTV